ncbi:KpsF/GutQ family sugar-phosphate isomerase [bacterium]|nr:KpsF/GutQ family sugar-phosphate isomerase [bacterium]
MPSTQILDQALQTLETEQEAIARLRQRIGEPFVAACELLLGMKGRAVVSGMGKSGAVGRKLSSTLASTGTPSFFMHPAEAIHGDLGMVTEADVVIFLSNSGETEEILNILPAVRRRGAGIISLCGAAESSLAQHSDVTLDASVECEACPLGLAPTASCIAQMALGDALAMSLMRARGFTTEDYAQSHPGGTLGRKVLWRVADVMHSGDDNPTVTTSATVLDALLTMSGARVRGAVSIVDEAGKLRGLFTDGDFRVLMQREPDRNAVMCRAITEAMTAQPTTTTPETLAARAAKLMQDREFDNLPVVDAEGVAVGMLDIQDLLKAGIV